MDFYDLSRIENSDYNLNIETIDINKELREHLLLFYNNFDKKNIEVDMRLEEHPVLVNLDESAIKRVFNNLIQNAIKYADSYFGVSINNKDDKVIIEFKNDVKDIDLSLQIEKNKTILR